MTQTSTRIRKTLNQLSHNRHILRLNSIKSTMSHKQNNTNVHKYQRPRSHNRRRSYTYRQATPTARIRYNPKLVKSATSKSNRKTYININFTNLRPDILAINSAKKAKFRTRPSGNKSEPIKRRIKPNTQATTRRPIHLR